MNAVTAPADGLLFREQGRPEVYLIRDGARLHIPNPYVMEAMGLDWNAVQTVLQGGLDHIARDRSWEPLAGRTPGSTVFVPWDVSAWWPNNGKVYWPLPLATTKRHVAWGQEVRTIELRGWINFVGQNNDDPDVAYDLELDVGWVLGRGIDLSALVKVGNILGVGHREPNISDPRAWYSTPVIHMEISGFPVRGQRHRKHPPDWTFEVPGFNVTNADAGADFNKLARWPFDPAAPLPRSVAINDGDYVRVLGSVVSDKAHIPENDPPMKDAVSGWRTGLGNNENDDARWTEIHPPDWIEVLPPQPVTQLLRGVTVIAPGTYPWRSRVETVLDVDIPAPPAKPRPDAVLRYREFVGPETLVDTIIEGNTTKTGAAITPIANGIRLHVKVGGTRSFVGGGPGKFRALYWLYWEVPPPTPQRPTRPIGPGPHRVTCASKRRIGRLFAVAAIGGVNADGTRWELSRDEAVEAIDVGMRFYVELERTVRVEVVVARRFLRRYLKTKGDRLRSNNLLRLPSC